MSPRGIELNLPDLPEVPISLGPIGDGPPQERRRRRLRPWDLINSWLPLLLAAALALGTWWLVRNAPQALQNRTAGPAREEPDYVMQGFRIQRYAEEGRLRLQIDGRELRHLPASDQIVIDQATVRAYAPDGRHTVGTASQIVSDARGTDVLLRGGARVVGVTTRGQAAEIEGEALRLYPKDERLRSEVDVRIRLGDDRLQAAGMDYTQRDGQLQLLGPMRIELAARAPAPPPRKAAAPRPAKRARR
jgi:lipopolysaccharide export system protein LptC